MNDLFTETLTDPALEIDESKDYLVELVGAGKKYQDEKALAKSVVYKDAHIKRLEQEAAIRDANYAKLNDEYTTAASLKELIDQLKSQKTDDTHEQPPVTVQQPMTKPEDMKSLFKQFRDEEVEETNFNTVQAKLKEKLGPSYGQVLNEKANQLGLTKDMVNSLARRSPTAFFNALGINDTQSDLFQAPPRSEFAPRGEKKRDWAFYQEMKKSDPKTYNKPETQVQLMQDRVALGDAFKTAGYQQKRGM